MTDYELAVKIAEKAAAAGGRVYFVGGFVRNKAAGLCSDSTDIDIEVHGLEAEKLREILGSLGTLLEYGSSFGIFGLAGSGLDIAMPRKEHATGRGHRDFDVFVDPFCGAEAAARRRDFTVNALMEDVLTGEIIDCFGGLKDLKEGVLRHVDSSSFAEDPLRVLRCAQFAARFGYKVAPETIELCREMDISALSRERVEGELKKALLKAEKPSVFFEVLRKMGQLSCWFTELEPLIGLEQDPVYHPEGDVWIHTMEVIDRAAKYREKVSDAYSFMLLALLHDLGKTLCTAVSKGRIHAYGHEALGQPLIETFLGRIVSDKAVSKYVLNMAPLHMKPNMLAYSKPQVKNTNRMFDSAAAPADLIYFAMSDKPVYSGEDPFTGDSGFLFERLKAYEETMAKPFVGGADLIAAGLKPGENFSELLAYAHKLRLAGIEKSSAIKQVLSYKPKK